MNVDIVIRLEKFGHRLYFCLLFLQGVALHPITGAVADRKKDKRNSRHYRDPSDNVSQHTIVADGLDFADQPCRLGEDKTGKQTYERKQWNQIVDAGIIDRSEAHIRQWNNKKPVFEQVRRCN